MEFDFDIIGVGESGVDLMYGIDQFPDKGEKSRAHLLGKYPGGMIGNFCSAAAKQGLRCGVVTAVGADEYGELLISDYEKLGIDTSGLVVDQTDSTFCCIVFIESDGEKRLVTVDTSLNSPPLQSIRYSELKKSRYVHMNSMDYVLVDTVTAHLSGSATKVSLDYEAHADKAGFENWKDIFSRVSILFLNKDSAERLLGERFEERLQELRKLGPEVLVVTCGSDGGIVCSENSTFNYDAVKVSEIRDTTGAGDCFNASFLASLINGYDYREAARYAAVAAALSLQKVGARSGQPTRAETMQFIKQIKNRG